MIHLADQYQSAARELGLDAERVFNHPLIRPWRTLKDRENCTLDAQLSDGRLIRWHIKRYRRLGPARAEARGHSALVAAGIPTANLVAWGHLPDGRSFVILEDLHGYQAADQLIQAGLPFERLRVATADLAARLHLAGLHHRDLYLCHFFARDDDVRLIDAARVRRLPMLLARRWIIKDLAQFWYSTLKLPISEPQRLAWLDHYLFRNQLGSAESMARKIRRKADWIGRHDARLRRQQPWRNIQIPQG